MFWFYTANLVIYSSGYKFFLIKISYIRPNKSHRTQGKYDIRKIQPWNA